MRPIRAWLNNALKRMDGVFMGMYEADAKGGRPSIAREKLVRALLLVKSIEGEFSSFYDRWNFALVERRSRARTPGVPVTLISGEPFRGCIVTIIKPVPKTAMARLRFHASMATTTDFGSHGSA